MTQVRFTVFLTLAAVLVIAPDAPADGTGGISPEFARKLQETRLTPAEQAIADIVANGSIKDVALNRAKYISHDGIINHRIKSGDVTNQKGSGRCWMFAGFNTLRPQVIKRFGLKSFEFSECYLQFWDKLEKANKFLQEMIDYADQPLDDRRVEIIIDSPLGDGGWWTYFVDLVQKYGVVPKETMPETYNSSATGTMNHLIGRKVMEMGLELRSLSRDGAFEKELRERKEGMLAEVYRMLVLNLGQPPREFTWRYEKSDSTDIATYPEPLTPKAFYEEVIDIELSAYVALFNYPGKDYYENYALEMSRNIYDRPNLALLNVPIDSIKACALRSILDSTAVWFACDVGKENYGKEGIMMLDIYNYDLIYGTEFEMAKKDLIELGMITPNHAMALVGVDTVSTRATKWLVENSWGEDDGDSGMWHMYNDWFDCYLFGAVIHQKYLSDELIEFSRKDPILLPPWDPMYALNHLE